MLRERTEVDAVERLDAFYAAEFGCGPELFSSPGVHVVPTRLRSRPGWGGYTKPLTAISKGQSLVVSVKPDLEAPVRGALEPHPPTDQRQAWAHFERLRRVSQRAVPYAFILSGYSMYCAPQHFRPIVSRAVRLERDDPRGRDLRSRFDGDLFVVFGSKGEIASWAAIKLKSDEIWEIAVVTESAYRGRGLAREVVASATAHILEHGRMPLYIYDHTNAPSGKVCRSLGYEEFGYEYFSEY